MSLYAKIVLIIFGLAYLISPVDIIPDILLPYIGWLDDGVVLATLFYLIRHGRLPDFLFNKKGRFKKATPNSHTDTQNTRTGQSPHHQADADDGRSKPRTESEKKRSASARTPWEVLGVNETATLKEIQAAYKEAVKKYHPDKLSHLGEEFSSLANEKFLEIQNAYHQLMKRY
jgi:hypothetical protein